MKHVLVNLYFEVICYDSLMTSGESIQIKGADNAIFIFLDLLHQQISSLVILVDVIVD